MSNQTTLRSRTAKWFECVVRYERQQEDGITKKVTEYYIVDALSFAEAEASITKEMQAYISGEFEVKNINPCPFSEIFFSDQATDDRWYKARLAFIIFDEKTEKEKLSYVYYLVQGDTFDRAKAYIAEVVSSGMFDYVIKSVNETKYIDVFEHTVK